MKERQHRNSRLMTFRDFINRRSLKEEMFNTSGSSFIVLDGSETADERQSAIAQFGEDLKELSSNGRIVIGMAVALD
jgi:SNF2 family DNA or RNA helicase